MVRESLDYYFKDNLFSWELGSDGAYHRRESPKEGFSAQNTLLKETVAPLFSTSAAAGGKSSKKSSHKKNSKKK